MRVTSVITLICGLLTVVSLCTQTHAQNFRLDLYLTYRAVTGAVGAETVTDVQTGGTVNAVVGQRYRVELRYRIADLTADTTGSRGLSSANIAFTRSGAGTSTGLRRANLTNDQAGASSPITNPDTSVLFTDADATSGLIGEFRGGLTSDTAPANGTPANAGWTILPLALSAPAASLSWGASGNPTAANTDANQNRFGLYAFEFVYGGGTVTFTVTAVPDPQTGNRFGYFARTGSTNNPVPQTSTLATDGSITFAAPNGACCDSSGGCSVVAQQDCGTLFLGSSTTCAASSTCPVAVGACCTAGGSCTATTPSGCSTSFRLSTACTPSLCVPGACCAVTGVCTSEIGFECTAGGRSFSGAATLCSPNPCPQPGACCLASTCVVNQSSACSSQGGVFLGQSTTCSPPPCPEACCLPGFACLVGTPANCTSAGGTPAGTATCSPLLCCPTPTFASLSPPTPFNPPGSVSLNVVASFPGSVSYQWRLGGVPLSNGPRITGVNTAQLMFVTTQPSDAGSYDCVVIGSCGRSATSPPIPLQLCSLPVVTTGQPTVAAPAGQPTTLSVSASGLGRFSYQWLKNGAPLANGGRISGVSTQTLSIANVQPSDQATYACVVTSDPCGASSSPGIRLQVVCNTAAFDCNSNGLCDALELTGLDDIGAPTPTANSYFGWSVAAGQGNVAVGERFADVSGFDDAGRVHLFELNGQTATWVATVNASDPEPNAEFGFSVSLDGQWLAASALKATSGGQAGAGAVYVYRRTGSPNPTWQFFQRVSEPTPTLGAQFGHSVSLKADRMVIGAVRGNGAAIRSGAAYVYRFNGLNWGLEAPLTAPDGATDDGFGISVAIDDPYLIASAPYDTDGNTTSGSAYIYFRGVGGWTLQSKIRPRSPQAGVPIGEAISISGDIAIVSSVLEDVNTLQDAGAAYVFRRTDTRWTQQRRLTAANPVAGGRFGYGLSVQGGSLVVGEFTRTVQGIEWAGSFDVFFRRGNFWTRAAQVNSPRPEPFGRFGNGLALDNGRLVATSFTGSLNGVSQSGWARVFSLAVLNCNGNSIPDVCDIAQGTVLDANGNGIPDSCETVQCRSDFNDSGSVTVQDVFDFLTDWFAGNLTADFNDSNVISVQDIFDFLNVWFTGC